MCERIHDAICKLGFHYSAETLAGFETALFLGRFLTDDLSRNFPARLLFWCIGSSVLHPPLHCSKYSIHPYYRYLNVTTIYTSS